MPQLSKQQCKPSIEPSCSKQWFYMIVIIVSIGLRLMENRSRLGQMQMRRIVSKYELGDMLGRGAYSEVFQARHLEDGKLYAIKVISNRVLAQNAKVKEYISNELAIHNVLQPCTNIVRFHQLLQTKNNCYFVYEYCEGGTLHQLIQRQGPLDERRAMGIFTQLVEGLKVLRKYNVMHRDLKPENVLIKQGHIKLADFGFCKELGGECMTRTMLGSPLYMAPQVLRGQAYSVNADIWSIGVILYEMLYGHCPFQSHSIAALISTIDDTLPAFQPTISVSSDVKKFISRCLQKDCRMRIAWEELFQEAKRLIEKSSNICFSPNNSSISANANLHSSQNLFLKSLTKVNSNSKHQSMAQESSNPKPSRSKSKYEIFKQNYNKLTQIKHENQTFDSLKGKQHLVGRQSDLHPKLKTHSASKSYTDIVTEHQMCWKLLNYILQKLQVRDSKIYPILCHLLKALRRVLDGIYMRINLDNDEMLPILSIVKYELIQIQKIYSEVEKVFPVQLTDETLQPILIPADLNDLWKKVQETLFT